MADGRVATLMTDFTDEVAEHRSTEYDPDPLFVNRWSPRSMSGEPLDEHELMSLFEAARWAPSSRNTQPWRFVYATLESDQWDTFVGLLNEGNRRWAPNAAVLVVMLSKATHDNGDPNPTHSFDTGAAWENLCLEATRRGLAVHGMAGFDARRAREELSIPDDFDVEAMAAIGHRASPEQLPEPLREREFPKGRKPLDELLIEGGF